MRGDLIINFVTILITRVYYLILLSLSPFWLYFLTIL